MVVRGGEHAEGIVGARAPTDTAFPVPPEDFSGRFSPVHAFVSASAWAVASVPRPRFPWNNATEDILGNLALAQVSGNGLDDGGKI